MGPFGSRKLRTLFEATYFVGLRKAGMPEALTAPNSAGTRFEGPLMLCPSLRPFRNRASDNFSADRP
jgi:hypothetical protein